MQVKERSRFLRLALRLNAVFSLVSAVVFVTFAEPIAAALGFVTANQVTVIGAQLALFSVWLGWLSMKAVLPRWQVWLIIVLDVVWVAQSFHLIWTPPVALSPAVKWSIGMIADIVAIFALLQYLGLRRIRRIGAPVKVSAG